MPVIRLSFGKGAKRKFFLSGIMGLMLLTAVCYWRYKLLGLAMELMCFGGIWSQQGQSPTCVGCDAPLGSLLNLPVVCSQLVLRGVVNAVKFRAFGSCCIVTDGTYIL